MIGKWQRLAHAALSLIEAIRARVIGLYQTH